MNEEKKQQLPRRNYDLCKKCQSRDETYGCLQDLTGCKLVSMRLRSSFNKSDMVGHMLIEHLMKGDGRFIPEHCVLLLEQMASEYMEKHGEPAIAN